MKLLLDANISWRIIPLLSQHFAECTHVNKTGIPLPPTDTQIWDYALRYDYIIVSHDYDFARLLESKGWPPKLVLLKTGNIDNDTTAQILINAKSHIADLYIYAYGLLEIE